MGQGIWENIYCRFIIRKLFFFQIFYRKGHLVICVNIEQNNFGQTMPFRKI